MLLLSEPATIAMIANTPPSKVRLEYWESLFENADI